MASQGSTGTSADAIEFLTSQHREVEQLWTMLQHSHEQGSGEQADLFERIVTMLSKHDAIETQSLYPELRSEAGEQGKRLAEHSLGEHRTVRELLSDVDGRDIHETGVYTATARCMTKVLHHAQEEEEQVFPALRASADQARLQDLGRRMAEMWPAAPTHPHPHTPDSKAGATIAGAVTGVVDHLRDAVRDARRNDT